jgi:predicted dithiol-disulfide oxidoreductase (DUF899 family)
MSNIADHRIASHEEWIAERKALLAKEKKFNRQRDELSALRRELPWERVTKRYVFDARPRSRTPCSHARRSNLAQICPLPGSLHVFHMEVPT